MHFVLYFYDWDQQIHMSFGKWQLGKCEKVDKCKTVEALKFLSKTVL